jgi:hypothetical protein
MGKILVAGLEELQRSLEIKIKIFLSEKRNHGKHVFPP